MKKKYYLTRTTRDEILDTLTDAQRQFIHERIRRGMATLFARELAAAEGSDVTDDMSPEEVVLHLKEWEFDDFQDAGPDWQRTSNLRCQCGKHLRYQFSVRHRSTQEILRFGEDHFADHMHLPPRVVQAIKSGKTDAIDYELDELLTKVQIKWKLPFAIPSGTELPQDIREHLDLGLPLLDRQVTRLVNLIPRPPVKQTIRPGWQYQSTTPKPPVPTRPVQRAPLPVVPPRTPIIRDFPDNLQSVVINYLEEGTTSARQLAERLIGDGFIPNNRSVTGLPDIYVPLVTFFRALASYKVIPKGNDCTILRVV